MMWQVLTDVSTLLLLIIGAVAVLILVCSVAVAWRRALHQRRYRTRDQLRTRYEPLVASLQPGSERELPSELRQSRASLPGEVVEAAILERLERTDTISEREYLSSVCRQLGYVDWHIERLSAKRARTRALAADRLGAIRHPAAVPVLAPALSDRDLDVRTVAARALGTIGGEEAWGHLVRHLLSASPDEPDISLRVIKSVLVAGGPAVVAGLEEGLKHPAWRIRGAVIDILGHLREEGAASRLPELLSDPEPDVRAKTARVLGQLGDASSVPALHNVLGDSAWVVRMHATRTLGVLGGASTSALMERLVDGEWRVRAAAAEALRRSGPEVMWSVWNGLSQCKDRYVREQLFEELQRSSLLQKYIGLLESRVAEERSRGEIVVEDCLREGVTSLILHSLKTHQSLEVRGRLIDLLAPHRRPDIVMALEEVRARDPEPVLRRRAQAALESAGAPPVNQGNDDRVV